MLVNGGHKFSTCHNTPLELPYLVRNILYTSQYRKLVFIPTEKFPTISIKDSCTVWDKKKRN